MNVGYRWYDSHNITPLFPFGFGLSYTTFGFSNLTISAQANGSATVKATVTFTLTPRDLAHWSGTAWTTNTGPTPSPSATPRGASP